jgi:hypothetical protein
VLSVAVLTALSDRDALVRRRAMRRASAATMAEDHGLSLRIAVEWCGSSITVGEITRYSGSTAIVRGPSRMRRMSDRLDWDDFSAGIQVEAAQCLPRTQR